LVTYCFAWDLDKSCPTVKSSEAIAEADNFIPGYGIMNE